MNPAPPANRQQRPLPPDRDPPRARPSGRSGPPPDLPRLRGDVVV